jgi:hypothetical protein
MRIHAFFCDFFSCCNGFVTGRVLSFFSFSRFHPVNGDICLVQFRESCLVRVDVDEERVEEIDGEDSVVWFAFFGYFHGGDGRCLPKK